jgi:hypothetical protein
MAARRTAVTRKDKDSDSRHCLQRTEKRALSGGAQAVYGSWRSSETPGSADLKTTDKTAGPTKLKTAGSVMQNTWYVSVLIRDSLIGISKLALDLMPFFKPVSEAPEEFRQHGHDAAIWRTCLIEGSEDYGKLVEGSGGARRVLGVWHQ